jgi:transposase
MQYLGVDHHKKFSYLALMSEKGVILKEGRINNSKESLKRFLNDSKEPKSAVLEAGRNWTVMHDWLEEELSEVKLANPKKVKAIAEAKIKTDKIDATILAHLLRSDLIPEAYVPKHETRIIKNILRQRMFFVKLSSMTKNRIHNIMDRHPELRGQIDPSDLFGKQGLEWLSLVKLHKEDKKLLNEQLDLLVYLTNKIKDSNHVIEKLGSKDKRVKNLMTIPGIGKFFALLIVSEIDKIERFRTKDKLASYAGLIPSVHSSADKTFYGKIVSHGNRYLRWALIEAVWPAIRKDLHLKLVYQKIRQHKNANVAKVAVARRLSTIVYRVLSENRTYIVNYPGRPHITLAVANN